MSIDGEGTVLDQKEIFALISELKPEARNLLQRVLSDVHDRGNNLSDAMINELAKKYSDKARSLVKSGGD